MYFEKMGLFPPEKPGKPDPSLLPHTEQVLGGAADAVAVARVGVGRPQQQLQGGEGAALTAQHQVDGEGQQRLSGGEVGRNPAGHLGGQPQQLRRRHCTGAPCQSSGYPVFGHNDHTRKLGTLIAPCCYLH